MIYLDVKRDLIDVRSDKSTMAVIYTTRSRMAPSASHERVARLLALIAAIALASFGVAWLTVHPGDWLRAIARVPAYLQNPDRAGADWLAPALHGDSLIDVIGAVFAALTVIGLIAVRAAAAAPGCGGRGRRIWQRLQDCDKSDKA